MRIQVEIEDRLMRQAMKISKERTKRGTVEAALRLLAGTSRQAKIREPARQDPVGRRS